VRIEGRRAGNVVDAEGPGHNEAEMKQAEEDQVDHGAAGKGDLKNVTREQNGRDEERTGSDGGGGVVASQGSLENGEGGDTHHERREDGGESFNAKPHGRAPVDWNIRRAGGTGFAGWRSRSSRWRG